MAVLRGYDTNIIELPNDFSELVEVSVKSNQGNYFTTTQNYNVLGNSLVLSESYAEIKVNIKTDTAYAQTEQRLQKEVLNKKLRELKGGASGQKFQTEVNKYQEQFVGQNGNLFLEMGQTIAGFQGLAIPPEENIQGSLNAFPVLSTPTAAKAETESTETVSNDAITGKTTGNGAPDLVITSSNPAGLNEVYQGPNRVEGLSGATPNEIKGILQSVSMVASSIDNSNIFDVVNQIAGGAGASSIASMLSFMKNPQAVAAEVLGNNIIPNLIGNIAGQIPGDFNKALSALDGTLSPLIDQFGQTGVGANTFASGIVQQFVGNQTTDLNQLGGNISTFTTSGHQFDFVDTAEELAYEISNIQRDITACMIHWSRTYANQFLTASDINGIHRALQEDKLGASGVAALNEKAGIMWHYCILKDGTLQRGRPIELELLEEMPFDKRTIHIGFIAGFQQQYKNRSDGSLQPTAESITDAQWKSFDLLIKTILELKSGIGIIGHSAVHNSSSCPGFDVDEYVREKFDYATVYTQADLDTATALTIEELSSRKPDQIASAGKTTSAGSNAEALAAANTNKDDITGKVIPPSVTELDTALSGYSSLQTQLNSLDADYINAETAVLSNNLGSADRSAAIDTLYALDAKRDAIEKTLLDSRAKLVNAGYILNEESGTWVKR